MADIPFSVANLVSPTPSASSPTALSAHRAVFVVAALALLAFSMGGAIPNPIDLPLLAGLAILILGVPHGAFDVALWTARNGGGSSHSVAAILFGYVVLAGGFFALWLLAPALALPVFILSSIYHFSGDWSRDLELFPRLVITAAIISAPAALHRAEVIEVFAWLSTDEIAATVATIMAAAAAPLLQSGLVVIVLVAVRRPWAAAELAAVLALAWLTPPLMFFLIYFCGLHSIRHVIETRDTLGVKSNYDFFAAAFPFAAIAICATLAGASMLFALPPGPALVGATFMALGALTLPHMIIVDRCASPPRGANQRASG